MGILRRLLGLDRKLCPSDSTQTPTTQPDPGETTPPKEDAHYVQDQAASVKKNCALCGATVEQGVIACPKCGKGLFESVQKVRGPEPTIKSENRPALISGPQKKGGLSSGQPDTYTITKLTEAINELTGKDVIGADIEVPLVFRLPAGQLHTTSFSSC